MKKIKGHVGLKLLIVIILCAGIGLIGYGIVKGMSDKTKEPKVEYERDLSGIDSQTKAKLKKFVDVVSKYDFNSGEGFVLEGANSLSDNLKLDLAISFAKDKIKKTDLTKDEFESMTPLDDEYSSKKEYGVLMISDYDSAYKEYFQTDPSYGPDNIQGLGTCPYVLGMNDSLGKIYFLYDNCEEDNSASSEFKNNILTYELKDNNYVVTQEIQFVYIDSKKKERYNLIWTFDNNLNFISTVKE